MEPKIVGFISGEEAAGGTKDTRDTRDKRDTRDTRDKNSAGNNTRDMNRVLRR